MATGYDSAKKMIGLHEKRDREKIRAYLKKYAKNDDININPDGSMNGGLPWCAAIMNAWERSAGKFGTGRLNARSFLKYGLKIKLQEAKPGDIVVFERGNNGYSGHVAYFVEKNKDGTIKTLGGNQADSICYANYTTSRLLGVRRS